ncbi:hypothetical protein PRIEUP_LOCUS1118, partial [Pristimantis euphronides]
PREETRPLTAANLFFTGAAFILVSAYKVPQTDCGPNKEYKQCGGSCRTTCNTPQTTICNRKCVPGCYCKEGYYELNDACIEKEQCEKCSGNMTYTLCGGCPMTCEDIVNGKLCTTQCRKLCACNEGYVLDKEGRCILLQDCPK